MSILDQTRSLPHIPGMPPVSQALVTTHTPDGPPNPEVLLALLARNKALEGKFILCKVQSCQIYIIFIFHKF